MNADTEPRAPGEIPSTLSPGGLARAMAGVVGGATVTSVRAEAVGTGQMADCWRCHLEYDRRQAGPRSVIVKLPSSDPKSVETAVALRNYEIEVSFYVQLSGELDVKTPAFYHASLDPGGANFILVLEDVAPSRQGDQLAGCSADEAFLAVSELPGLHAPLWGADRLRTLDWLHRSSPGTEGVMPALVRALHAGFVGRYHERVDPEVLATAERLMERLDIFDSVKPGPWTVTHGDFRLDNLLFPPAGTPQRVNVVDWQTASHGPGVADLSYFIGASLDPSRRAEVESDLVRSYQERMRAAGIDLRWNDLWESYRRYSLGGLVMAIAASMLVRRTPRGDDMFMAMANRHGRHAIDLEALELLT